ncbi:hypothetical protein [Streptomyces violascens]|uniref:Uncharacterized protein n=1 Tax=Streptomyces violascens TaxID=67381 RepID=A0ABQ3QSH0_9ACTN|nr:hypothetical protein [Streptomyces violascens]GGU33012.1 hypothetical protein GCM10010289_62810 [Streptomyces violascens]GHI40222.1 hypothetical protein Sviol_46300 [Streptomyces violascens]
MVRTRAQCLHIDIDTAGIPCLARFLALAFHPAVGDNQQVLATTIGRLQPLTAGDDFAYFTDIAAAMGNLPHPASPAVRRLTSSDAVHERWHALVIARRGRTRASTSASR